MTKFFVLAAVLLLTGVLPGMASGRFVTKIKLPAGQTVVVAEGEFEARSIGSFSIRLYQAASGGNETTFFTSGLIRSRDGTIERVVLSDINDDGHCYRTLCRDWRLPLCPCILGRQEPAANSWFDS